MALSLLSGNFDAATFFMQLLYRLPAVLLALSVHEAAHAYAAFKAGDPTARNLGRMTLDLTKHIDPVGLLCLLFFGFGWAKPVPINSRNFRHYKRDNIMVSLAGIISNFILSFIAAGIFVGVYFGLGFQNEIFLNLMLYIIMINISLGIFNLLPIPPLDGSHVLGSFLKGKAARAYAGLQRYGFWILIIMLLPVFGGYSLIGLTLGNFTNWLVFDVYFPFFGMFLG